MLCCWLAPAVVSAGEQKTLPVMVTVTAAEGLRGTSRGDALVEAVRDALVRAGWEVTGENIEGPTSRVLAEAGFRVQDEAARLGMGSEAGVLVVVQAKDSGGHEVNLSAVETGTARILGRKSGGCGTSGGEEAGSRACDELVSALAAQVRARLDVEPVTGRHWMLVFISPPKHFDFKMHRELLKLCTFRENVLSTRGLAVFHLHSELGRDALAAKVADVIRRIVPGAQFSVHKARTQYVVYAFGDREDADERK